MSQQRQQFVIVPIALTFGLIRASVISSLEGEQKE